MPICVSTDMVFTLHGVKTIYDLKFYEGTITLYWIDVLLQFCKYTIQFIGDLIVDRPTISSTEDSVLCVLLLHIHHLRHHHLLHHHLLHFRWIHRTGAA